MTHINEYYRKLKALQNKLKREDLSPKERQQIEIKIRLMKLNFNSTYGFPK